MKTTATNRKIRVLLKAIRDSLLIPRPDFQRRLVWTSRHKAAFLETVLLEYPFPEIYIAAGEVDPDSAEGTEMLVDGQQRVTTLYQYFNGDPELKLTGEVPPYTQLDDARKRAFLEYEVVVRDLGVVPLDIIREVFERINSTRYALNAMELHNARYEGAFKQFGEALAQVDFFEKHQVFTATDTRRMQDVRFALVLTCTAMSGYFNRDDEVEEYLKRFNDLFPMEKTLFTEFSEVFALIEALEFAPDCRVWKKSDLFTIVVELYWTLHRKREKLQVSEVGSRLRKFYEQVDAAERVRGTSKEVREYHHASVQASNDRSSRIRRGEVIASILAGTPDFLNEPAGLF